MQRLRLWIVMLVLFTLSWNSTVNAQTNLLRDPGFEGEAYKNVAIDPADENTRFNVPVDWEGWYSLSPHQADWMNVYPNGFPQIGWPRRSGNRSVTISRAFGTFTVALYQRVTVGTGNNVQGGGWVYSENPAGTARAGIDPNGGTNPYDTDIVWGNWVSGPNSNFFQTTVDATATGDTVTLFLFATQSSPSDPNGVYWDDAFLQLGGNGGAVPGAAVTPGGTPVSGVPVVPTTAPPSVAGFVQPQAPQADGSIVHVVQTGDTLAAIAFAYGVSMEQIQQQNNISNPRFISVGQRLIIVPADEDAAPASNDNDTPATSEADPPANDNDNTAPPEADDDDGGGASILSTSVPVVQPTAAPPAPVREVAQNGVDPTQTGSRLCVVMFEDDNQNRIQEEDEGLLGDGSVIVTSDGDTVEEADTDDSTELCFEDLASGDYVVSGSAPNGYGLTTPDQLQVRLFPGETLFVAFGAAEGVEIAAVPTADSQRPAQVDDDSSPTLVQEPSDTSPMRLLLDNSGYVVFGLAGLVMVIGLGITAFGLLRRR